MRKKGLYKKVLQIRRIGIIILFISIFLVSVGYSAYREDLSISNIVSNVVASTDIRIINFSVNSSSEVESYSNSVSYTSNTITTSVHLNDRDSWVKYQIKISNLGNERMGIANILDNILPSELTYEINDYNIGDAICDDESINTCTLNAIKTFYITIKYKSSIIINNPADYNVTLETDFKQMHNVTYSNGICNNCPREVIGGRPFSVTLVNYLNIEVFINSVLTTSLDYSFNTSTGVFSLDNVVGDIEIINIPYTPIEYIESQIVSGSVQYINTLYTPNANTTVIFDGMVVSGDTALFGSRRAVNDILTRYTFQFIGANKYRSSYIGKDYEYSNNTYILNNRYVFSLTPTTAKINDAVVTTFPSTLAQGFGDIYLLALNTNNIATHPGIVRVYNFQIYENNVLLKNLIPVLDMNDTPCMYDTVNGEFYLNQGEGEFNYTSLDNFTITNNIENVTLSNHQTAVRSGQTYTTTIIANVGNQLPEKLFIKSGDIILQQGIDYDYNYTTGDLSIDEVTDDIVLDVLKPTYLAYMQSTGSQYIDTGYVPNANTKIIYRHLPLVKTYDIWIAFFGCRYNTSNSDAFYVTSGKNSKVSAYVGSYHYGDDVNNILYPHDTSGKVEELILSATEFTLKSDGVVKFTYQNTTPVSFSENTNSIFVFGRNAGTGILTYGGASKFLSMEIYENNVLIHEFKPAILQNGVIGLYDTIDKRIHLELPNSNNNTFIIPQQ